MRQKVLRNTIIPLSLSFVIYCWCTVLRLPWSMVYMPSETPLEKDKFPFVSGVHMYISPAMPGRHCFLGVMHAFCQALSIFLCPLLRSTWALRCGVGEYVLKSLTLETVQLWVSMLVPSTARRSFSGDGWVRRWSVDVAECH